MSELRVIYASHRTAALLGTALDAVLTQHKPRTKMSKAKHQLVTASSSFAPTPEGGTRPTRKKRYRISGGTLEGAGRNRKPSITA